MRRLLLVAVALATTVVVSTQERFDAAAARRLAGSALNGRALDYATTLTATVGARLSGSAAYDRAAVWAVEQFGAVGIRDVSRETFSIPRTWSRESRATARIVEPVDTAIVVESLGWAPPTPEDGVEGEIVTGGQELASSPDRVRGRIVLVTGSLRRDADGRLKEAGALAILFPDSSRDNLIAARVRAFGGEIAPLPEASIAADSADEIRDLLRRGPVRVKLSLRNRISDGPSTMANVIAELQGRERPDEFVIVGAHLDSWDFATGAQDNATGVAMVLEAARAIATFGRPPRRSIRFALWGAEEQGLLGSTAYVRAHESELDRFVAVLNTDGGTGRIIGWTTPGRDDVMARVRELARSLLADLKSTAVDSSMQYADDSDGGPFIRQGIPTLDLNVDDGPYETIHHKATDTIERVDARNLAVGAATVAVTAYAIADAPVRIAPRGSRNGDRR